MSELIISVIRDQLGKVALSSLQHRLRGLVRCGLDPVESEGRVLVKLTSINEQSFSPAAPDCGAGLCSVAHVSMWGFCCFLRKGE